MQFNLRNDDDAYTTPHSTSSVIKLIPSQFTDPTLPSHVTVTLNPNRPLDILSFEIFDLLCTQMKYIGGTSHKSLLQSTAKVMLENSLDGEEITYIDFDNLLWGEDSNGAEVQYDGKPRGRSSSPVMFRHPLTSSGDRRPSRSSSSRPLRQSFANASNNATNLISNADSDNDADRRSRSTSRQARPRVRGQLPAAGGRGPRISQRTAKEEFGRAQSSQKESDGSFDELFNQVDRENLTGALNESPSADIDVFKLKFNPSFSELLKMPPEVAREASEKRGHYKGIWLIPHPLLLQPRSCMEMRNTIHENNVLTNAKKKEWELDMMRENDSKRFDRFESFLISSRSTTNRTVAPTAMSRRASFQAPANTSVKPMSVKSDLMVKKEYYRDKARQPLRETIRIP
jgi:hypothetical protein